ncbi:nudix hydrolase 15, mitochondrial-like [Hibiscus syriacus]|uniref:nudix hydrolase 15, mitochondrial-like n=1 Tax=Hibiscus syriacus TaxID=106335 RepID=UPI001922D58E|nr:nudix hydrolase 15, mitochondrial-like [Hibiscus syriacus]
MRGSYDNLKHGADVLENSAQRLRLYKSTRLHRITGSLPLCSDSKSDHQHPQNLRRSAVLVCIFQGNNGHLRLILTKRSSTLSSHSGEVALPGGKRDETDVDTALREANEEIGLDPSLVNVVAVLEPMLNKHRTIVVPVVGILSDAKAFDPCPCADEVEAIFDAPLEMFLKDENRRTEKMKWMGQNIIIHYFEYEIENAKYLIWAFTAAVLTKVASVVYERLPDFSELDTKSWDVAITGYFSKMRVHRISMIL